MATLDALATLIETVHFAQYSEYQDAAMQRIARRDADDWVILASAMRGTNQWVRFPPERISFRCSFQ